MSILGKVAVHNDSEPILVLDNVSVHYNGSPALENISFQLEVGERVAIVGPNGAGKSTLFKVIAGLLNPTRGRAKVRGYEPGGHVCISYIPQRSQVDLGFPVTVSDVVMMGRIRKIGFLHWPRQIDHQIVDEALDLVDMKNFHDRQIGELSGGQQQRVFIAQALAQEAELMLMDEPLTGLDVHSQKDIMAIWDILSEKNVTIVVATHDLALAADAFDRLLLLNHRLISIGKGRETLTPERLEEAYGDKMHIAPTHDNLFGFDDACCDGRGHQHHD